MNRRAKSLALLALCAAVAVLLVWQRTQITKLNRHHAELRAQLAAPRVEVQAPQVQPTASQNPDSELLRLRTEVAELRRHKIALTPSAADSGVKLAGIPIGPDELPLEIRQQQATRVLMRLVLAMHMIMVDREEVKDTRKLPVVGANGELSAEMRRECEKLLKEGEETSGIDLDQVWRDLEVLITDGAEIRKLDPNTVVARTVPMKMPNGKWKRVYAIADGSAHQRVHNTPDEVWQAPAP